MIIEIRSKNKLDAEILTYATITKLIEDGVY